IDIGQRFNQRSHDSNIENIAMQNFLFLISIKGLHKKVQLFMKRNMSGSYRGKENHYRFSEFTIMTMFMRTDIRICEVTYMCLIIQIWPVDWLNSPAQTPSQSPYLILFISCGLYDTPFTIFLFRWNHHSSSHPISTINRFVASNSPVTHRFVASNSPRGINGIWVLLQKNLSYSLGHFLWAFKTFIFFDFLQISAISGTFQIEYVLH
ncbi:hypothetical protein ACJX0J_036000, partial [Zea mays]